MGYMVFDVESIGLYGEGYAVGWVCIDKKGKEQKCGYLACPSDNAIGADEGRIWIRENVDIHLPEPNRETPKEVRKDFWDEWVRLKNEGYELVADVSWPVESNFLLACVWDNYENRKDLAPYPLHDVRNFYNFTNLAIELSKLERIGKELPQHNPIADARFSAKQWVKALEIAKKHGL